MTESPDLHLHLPLRTGEVPPPTEIGGKAHNLARLGAAEVEVPPWFAIPAAVFEAQVVGDADLAGEWDAAALRHRALGAETPPAFREAVSAALAETGLAGLPLAVRSSAVAEDAAGASFAGQFATVLGVPGEAGAVLEAVRQVWASAFSPHAVAYGGGGSMAVVVQEMVDPQVSGVAFGADPVTGRRDVAVVSAVYGLGEGLVSGEMDADSWRIATDGKGSATADYTVESTRIASKPRALQLAPDGGTRTTDVPTELRDAPSLTEVEALTVARTVRRLGDVLGAPQDVEWALVGPDRRLVILQARPITTLGQDEVRRLWDNSNIVESYAGITSPLTFSFARSVYEDVYRQFCALVGVSPTRIDRNRQVFANMLGLVRGRVFYNLRHWYQVLAMLPGFSLNRAFMERMMGVSEPLSDTVPGDSAGKTRDAVRVGRMVRRLVLESRRLGTEVPAFHAHVGSVLDPLRDTDLTGWTADRLTTLYRRLEEELLRRWQTPIVNDFFAMLWFGLLGRLVERWLPGEPPTLVNDLLTHEGGVISTEPARRVTLLTESVRGDRHLRELFEEEPDDDWLLSRIRADFPAFHGEVEAYIAVFGDRCMNELKLETVTLREDPTFLMRTIRGYLSGDVRPADPEDAATVRVAAEARVRRGLGAVRRRIFRAVLRQTRARVRDRENLRFERTRVFGLVRRIFLGFGHHFVQNGLLDEPRDVFYLTVDEIFDHVDGAGTAPELRALVDLRRETWRGYEEGAPPPDRFESIGPPELGRWIVPASAPREAGKGLGGLGCCPGIVCAPVRIVRDPTRAGELAGHILVAERTDPGWTLLFPQARGILVERGSLLSHSAIVAREMGIPCVVAVPGLLDTLRDGEVVEMDGTAGTIRRVEEGRAPAA